MANLLDIVAGVAGELGLDISPEDLADGGVTIYFEEKVSQENRKKLADQFDGEPKIDFDTGKIIGIKKSSIIKKIENGVKRHLLTTKFSKSDITVTVKEDRDEAAKITVNLHLVFTPEELQHGLDPTLDIIRYFSYRGLGVDRDAPSSSSSRSKDIPFNRFFDNIEYQDEPENQSVKTFIQKMNLVTRENLVQDKAKDQKAAAETATATAADEAVVSHKDSFHGRELMGSSVTGKTSKTVTESSVATPAKEQKTPKPEESFLSKLRKMF